MGKKAAKKGLKKKCCGSRPRCARCPVRAARAAKGKKG